MIVKDGVKYSCSKCIRGHKTSKCTHTDSQLFVVRKRGRPLQEYSRPIDQRSQLPGINHLLNSVNHESRFSAFVDVKKTADDDLSHRPIINPPYVSVDTYIGSHMGNTNNIGHPNYGNPNYIQSPNYIATSNYVNPNYTTNTNFIPSPSKFQQKRKAPSRILNPASFKSGYSPVIQDWLTDNRKQYVYPIPMRPVLPNDLNKQ